MQRTLLKSKLHQAKVTAADLNYEGSFSIDAEIMNLCNIVEYEQIHVYNITNGQRYVTYAISAPSGSRIMCANGACARLTAVVDRRHHTPTYNSMKRNYHALNPSLRYSMKIMITNFHHSPCVWTLNTIYLLIK